MWEKSAMKMIWAFLRPNFVKIALLIILLIISLIVIVKHESTSKVSWEEDRGGPFTFISIAGYKGPCPLKTFCQEVNILDFSFLAFLIDFVVWYLVSCTIIKGLEAVKKQDRHRLH
jgi:hypothetical protein